MNYWLFSTEPDYYPWQKVEAEKKVRWDEIRGAPAQRHMRSIEPGDEILAYHTAPEKSVVGIAKAVSRSYPDPKNPPSPPLQKGGRGGFEWHVIDVAWKQWLKRPMPLAEMRKTPALAKMKFLKIPRLSISPVTPAEWEAILAYSN